MSDSIADQLQNHINFLSVSATSADDSTSAEAPAETAEAATVKKPRAQKPKPSGAKAAKKGKAPVAKKRARKPKAVAKAPEQEQPAPTPVVELATTCANPGVDHAPAATSAWFGRIRYRIPANSPAKSVDGSRRIHVPLAQRYSLMVKGSVGQLDLRQDCVVDGILAIRRRGPKPRQLKSLILAVCKGVQPTMELLVTNQEIPGALWSKRLSGCWLSIVPLAGEVQLKIAA